MEMERVFVGPGELYVAEEPASLVIVLGSCVAVTFHCRRLGLSMACHCLLPNGPAGDFRYVNSSVNWMADRFRKIGIGSRETEVLLFGGGYMFAAPLTQKGLSHVGRENSVKARQILKEKGYRLAGGEIGGRTGRKIYYNTATGRALVKRTGSFGAAANRMGL